MKILFLFLKYSYTSYYLKFIPIKYDPIEFNSTITTIIFYKGILSNV